MYSKVIVPLDGSKLAEQALPHAQLVAGALSVPLELVEAFDVFHAATDDRTETIANEEMLADAWRRSRRYLGEVQAQLEAAGHRATTATLPGTPQQAIVYRVAADPDALVVMSTHGRGGFARWALGSVTDRVLHTVRSPVLVVRATEADPAPPAVERVLAPLDGSELAEAALEHAVNLVVALGAGLSLVRVSPTQEYYRQHLAWSGISAGASVPRWVNDMMRVDAETAGDYLAAVQRRLAAEHPDLSDIDTLHLRHDSVPQAIMERSSAQPTLVVMATHGRGGIGRLILGSVTDRVVRHSEAPVLVVRR